MRCILISAFTELAFWRMCPFTPVVKLDIIPAKVGHMLCHSYPIHFWVQGACCFDPTPPHQVKIYLLDNVFLRKERSCCLVPPACFQSLARRSNHEALLSQCPSTETHPMKALPKWARHFQELSVASTVQTGHPFC